jgi:hypothetical protein
MVIPWIELIISGKYVFLSLKTYDVKIGGPDKIVEIDEIVFTRRKNNAGIVLS